MNWKIFGTFLMVLTLVTSVALGQGTAPTILEGNYISNVFGQSNFIKNPNAKLNTNDVTVSSATVSRSPTTALVATSEFNVAVTSANGTITWATRSFDAGMKNQNCEARFTYRGFQSTSKAHVKQGANTVATLNLSATGTDPRIASINFPCGDLSTATTFVVTDTAILAGTNEIGGIYVGLATNQANVAQAEFIGSVRFGTNCLWTTTSSTYNSPTDSSCSTTAIGNVAADTASVTKPSIIVNDTRPGNYYAVWSGGSFQKSLVATYQYCSIRLVDGNIAIGSYVDPTNLPVVQTFSTSASFQYNTSSTKTFQLQMKSSDNTTSCTLNTSTDEAQITVYRFPTSSELVVKPETQNTWGSVKFTPGGTVVTNYSTPSNQIFNNATAYSPSTASYQGKAIAQSASCGAANNLGLCIPTVLPGTYEVTVDGVFDTIANVAGNGCQFEIFDGTAKGGQQEIYNEVANIDKNIGTIRGVFTYTSVQTNKPFSLRVAGNSNQCRNVAGSARPVNMVFQPLDQPSNSALYVQGPVLGAQTGATIAEGYVNEFSTRSISDSSARTQTNPALATVYYPWSGTLTLPAGNWNICYKVLGRLIQNEVAAQIAFFKTWVQNQTDGTFLMTNSQLGQYTPTYNRLNYIWGNMAQCKPVAITSSKTFRVGISYENNTGTATVAELAFDGGTSASELYAIRLN